MSAIQTNSVLVNESQLGVRLNQAIGSNRRGEFGLLLSLLSIDARDMAQFNTEKYKSADLRAKFDLPEQQRLLNQLDTDELCIDNSQVYQQGGVTAFRLANALHEEAMVIRRNETLDMEEVLANCELNVRNKYKRVNASAELQLTHFVDQLQMQRKMSEFIAQA